MERSLIVTRVGIHLVWCLLFLHSPEGSQIIIESGTINVLRPVTASARDHVAANTHTVIYAGVRPNGFGVREHVAEIVRMMGECKI